MFQLESHEKWVHTGNRDEDEGLYPLAPGAYKDPHTGNCYILLLLVVCQLL